MRPISPAHLQRRMGAGVLLQRTLLLLQPGVQHRQGIRQGVSLC